MNFKYGRINVILNSTFAVILFFAASTIDAINCDLTRQPLVKLVFNESGSFVEEIGRQRRLNEPKLDLAAESRNSDNEYAVPAPAVHIGTHPSTIRHLQPQGIYLARACWCASNIEQKPDYCLIQTNQCTADSDSGGSQACYNNVTGLHFVRGVVPAMIFFWCCLLWVFVVSEQGSGARSHAYRKIISGCGCNRETEALALDEAVTRLQEHNPQRARFLFRGALRRHRTIRRARNQREQRRLAREDRRRRRRFGELQEDPVTALSGAEGPSDRGGDNEGIIAEGDTSEGLDDTHSDLERPNQLALKTRIYEDVDEKKGLVSDDDEPEQARLSSTWTTNLRNQFKMPTTTADEEMKDEMHNGLRCAICLTLLKNGDRVGDLICQHVFHVNCLKMWLKRKNQCPLCNLKELAEPRFCPPVNEDTTRVAIPTTAESSDGQLVSRSPRPNSEQDVTRS